MAASAHPDASSLSGVAESRKAKFSTVNRVRDARKTRRDNAEFYTPEALIEKMIEWANVYPSARTLEPSAGDGRIVHALQSAGVESVDVCEIDAGMRERLASMGAKVVGEDFLKYRPEQPYNRIVMNPPFKGKTAQKHIEHAWSMLAPAGVLIAIAPKTLAETIQTLGMKLPECEDATYERLGPDWFKDFDTKVETIAVELRRMPITGRESCLGYSNHATANAILTIDSCAEKQKKAMGLDGADEFRDAFAKQIAEDGASVYGINWEEVGEKLWAIWIVRHHEEIEAAAVPAPQPQSEVPDAA